MRTHVDICERESGRKRFAWQNAHGNARAHEPGSRSRRGFSLVETLMALLILGVLSAMVVSAIPSAVRAYTNAVNGSNARTALSTTTTALRDELGMASDVVNAAGDSSCLIQYTDGRGRKCELRNYNGSSGDDAEAVMKSGIYKDILDPSSGSTTSIALVPDSAMTSELGVVCSGISYDASTGVIEVQNLEVRDRDQKALASISGNVYKIRPMGI